MAIVGKISDLKILMALFGNVTILNPSILRKD